MKKNVMMRVASVLMVAVLLTTCAISGTFAKYVTSADVEDSARVAKWGVTVTASGSLFEEEYANDGAIEKDNGGNDIAMTVVSSSASQDVIAPGTFNDEGFTFTIDGTPEVAVNIDFAISNVKDVYVPAADATYLDYTTGNNLTDTFDLADDYYPIVYTLTRNGAPAATGTLEDIETYLDSIEGNYAANTDLSGTFGTFKLTWAWVFGDDANNKVDTFLGQIAAGKATLPSGASIDAGITMEITVAQID